MNWIAKLDAWHRLALSLLMAAASWLILPRLAQPSTRLVVTWDVFAFSFLLLAWLMIITTPVQLLRARAQKQDLSRTLISVFVVSAACAGLFAVGYVLFANRNVHRPHTIVHLLISAGAVISSWSLVHTIFGLRYAHIYYGDPAEPGGSRQHAGNAA